MERSQLETTSFCFSHHRHLKSETYRTLVQILSHCYDHSEISIPQYASPGICRRELVGPNALFADNYLAEEDQALDGGTGADGIQDGGFCDAQVVPDGIEDILQVEENDNLLRHDLAVCNGDGDEGTGNYDKRLDRQKMLMDELELIMKGDEIFVQEEDVMVNDRQEHVDVQQSVNGESRSEAELLVDKADGNLNVPKTFDSSLNRNMDSQGSIPAEDSEERNSILRTNSLEVENEIQQKEMEVEKLVHTNGIGACDFRAEDVEVEEGEISGGFELDEDSIDLSFGDAAVSMEMKDDEKPVSKDITDKRDFPCNGNSGGTKKLPDSVSDSMSAIDHNLSGRAVELKETVRNQTLCQSKIFADETAWTAIDAVRGAGINKRKASGDKEDFGSFSLCLDNSTGNDETVKKKVNQKQGVMSEEKLDSGVCNKKKRSALSQEKKAKKKQKERKKRAEKNRQLGVRRLKLPQNLKPKTVRYCHHYLKGRCHEGDNCKFSHDTVPLTKSTKACCHFARNSCMKGDSCPFDHDLSKYPCDQFVTKRFCNRGDDCLFSHKIPSKEEKPSTLSTCTPELKPPTPLHASNLLKKLNNNQVFHQNVDAVTDHGKVSSLTSIEQNVSKSLSKPPALAPKGISCLFLGRSSVLESDKLNQGSSSPKKSDTCKFAKQAGQIAFGAMLNRDESPRRTPVASKGVNFLSFGNNPLCYSSGKKLANPLGNSRGKKLENGANSPSKNSDLHEKSGSSNCGENSAAIGVATNLRFLSSVRRSNDMPKESQPAITAPEFNHLSSGKASANNKISKQIGFHSSVGDVVYRSLEDSPNTADMSQNSIANPWRLPGSSFSKGHSLDNSVQGYYGSASNSAQRTLEFATKIEPTVKINQSAVGIGVNSDTRGTCDSGGSTAGSYNDSVKASNTLFTGVSSRTEQ